MKFFILIIFTFSLRAQVQIGEIEPELVSDSVDGKTLKFVTDEGVFYRIQQSSNLLDWDDIVSFDGLGAEVVVPIFSGVGGAPGSSSGTGSDLQSVRVTLVGTTNGGTLVSWRSFDSGAAIQTHVLTVDVEATWSTIDLVNFATESYWLFVQKEETIVAVPTGLPSLGPEDTMFMNELLDEYSNISTGNFQSAYVGAAVAAGAQFFRVVAEVADIDRDGIPDQIETQAPPNGTGTDPWKPDTDGDGFWDGAEEAQNTDSSNPLKHPDPGTGPGDSGAGSGGGPFLNLLNFQPIEIGFHENHVLQSDNGRANYRFPQWVRDSHNYPVSYAKGGSISLSGKFELPSSVTAATVQVFGPNGIVFPSPVMLRPSGGLLWHFPETKCNGALVDTIKFYSAQTAGSEFVLNWIVTDQNNNVLTASGPTKHTMYVTHGKPIPGDVKTGRLLRQESLFNIGCRNANGWKVGAIPPGGEAPATPLSIVEKIYDEFEDWVVARVVPTQGVLRNEAMTYWRDTNNDGKPDGACSLSWELLARDDGNANCQAWAFLLSDILRAQGFQTKRVYILPADSDENSFAVKKMVVLDPLPNSDPVYQWIYGLSLKESPPGVLLGAQGQGLHFYPNPADPKKVFTVHYLMEFEEVLFDPSYGTPSIAGADRLKVYEDTYLEFFGGIGEYGGEEATFFRKNDEEKLTPEITSTIAYDE